MGRPKGSRNKPKSEIPTPTPRRNTVIEGTRPSTSPEKPKRSRKKKAEGSPELKTALNVLMNMEVPSAVSAAPEPTSNRAIIDLTTGQIIGPDRSLDLRIIPETKYSHSFISTIATCTAQAYFRKSHAKKQLQYPMEKGSCIHALIEGYLKYHKDPIKELPAAWKYWITDHLEEMSPEHQEKALQGYKDAEQILEEFVAENNVLLPQIRPEDVEVPFDIEITVNTAVGPVKRKLTGKIDLALFSPKRDSYGIIDWKSGSTVPSPIERKRNVQFCIYTKAGTEIFGKAPKFLEFYVLPGQHLCDERFSSKKHPRPLNERIPDCKGLQYAFRVPVPSPDEIQEMIDLYYGNQLIKWEAGLIGKDGLHDYKNNCMRCMYKEACDEWKKPFPAPVFVR